MCKSIWTDLKRITKDYRNTDVYRKNTLIVIDPGGNRMFTTARTGKDNHNRNVIEI